MGHGVSTHYLVEHSAYTCCSAVIIDSIGYSDVT